MAFVVQSRGRQVRLGSRDVADELTRELAFEHGSALMTSAGGTPIMRCRRLGKKVSCLIGTAALDGAKRRRRRKRR